nr:MAG TPA: hypothetical protein [Herelleviridae sp.]
MARRRGERPELFRDAKAILGNLSRAVVDEVLSDAQNVALGEGASVQRMPNYLIVTESRMAKSGVIDLKPFFAKSSKKKYNKKGEWYLYIPIKMKTRGMSRRLYDDLRSVPTGTKPITVKTDFLYDRRKQSPSVSSINYKPKSTNVTILPNKWGDGKRNTYVAFRTVNANSPANSWIINRDKVSSDTMSKTMLANIDRLMKWKLKNIGG